MTGTEPHAWGTGLMDNITFVGLDVHKATVCIAVAEGGRGGEVRQLGVFENRPEILSKLVLRLSMIPFEGGRPGQDGSPRRADAGEATSHRRTDGNLDTRCCTRGDARFGACAGDRGSGVDQSATTSARLHMAA